MLDRCILKKKLVLYLENYAALSDILSVEKFTECMFNIIDPKRFVIWVILMIQQNKIWIVILKILIWRAQKKQSD